MAPSRELLVKITGAENKQPEAALDLLRRQGFETEVLKCSEDALRKVNQIIFLLTNNMKEAVMAYDMDRHLVYVNPAIEELTGYSVEELKREHFICWVHPEDQERMLAYWDKLFAGDSYENVVYRMVTKDGQEKWVEASWGPLLDETGRQVGVQGRERDVTARRLAEQERTRLAEQLQHAQTMECVGRLAGGVAHDFNNLLTVINGYCSLALEQLPAGDNLRTVIEEIAQAGERAAELVKQLLAFSRKQPMRQEVLNLNDVIAGMERTMLSLAGEDIEVILRLKASLWPVLADRRQLEQAILNLVINARDAMTGGGTLTITTSNITGAARCANCPGGYLSERYVRMAIRGTGVGIDEQAQAHLFEPFFTTKDIGKGTGLGLAMVHGVVTQNGGYICVESKPGQGAEFRICFPAAAQAGQDNMEPGEEESPPAGTETILLVEDQREVRELLAATLRKYGYRVIEASDGEEALRHGLRNQIDLLVTDVVMPRLQGGELAERLRARLPALKVLFISGYSAAIPAQGRSEAVTELLNKPFTPRFFATKVREVLDRQKPALRRILVVDDEAAIRELIRHILEPAGYKVMEAASGRQALAAINEGLPDLVITDLVMPDQEGIETIRELKKQHPELRVIAMSGAGGGRYLPAAKLLGADVSLTKPIRPQVLLREVQRILSAPQ